MSNGLPELRRRKLNDYADLVDAMASRRLSSVDTNDTAMAATIVLAGKSWPECVSDMIALQTAKQAEAEQIEARIQSIADHNAEVDRRVAAALADRKAGIEALAASDEFGSFRARMDHVELQTYAGERFDRQHPEIQAGIARLKASRCDESTCDLYKRLGELRPYCPPDNPAVCGVHRQQPKRRHVEQVSAQRN